MRYFTKPFLSAVLFAAVAAPMHPSVLFAASENDAQRHALDRSLPELKFASAPLSDVLDFLSDSTASNFSVDWKALDAAHVAKDAPITLRMSSRIRLSKVLKLVLEQAGGMGVLTYYVDQGVIEITSQEASDKILISRTYPIQDLLFVATDNNDAPDLSLQNASQGQSAGGSGGGGSGASTSGNLFTTTTSNTDSQKGNTQQQRADDIIKMITDTVKPELWTVNGGTATISFFRGSLIVNAPRSIHELLESE